MKKRRHPNERDIEISGETHDRLRIYASVRDVAVSPLVERIMLRFLRDEHA